MIKKLLIANRGEIACRVIKTAKQMGIGTVAVFSEADRNALHVKHADEAVFIGGSAAKESYLVIDKVIEAAKRTGADAIHPGYGFLSENAAFAKACADNAIIFVGPPASAIEAMGSKSAAKAIMEKAGVPLVPGYHGDDQAESILKQTADEMGYPVLLKAAAGGGGKGMRQVWSESEFSEALAAAKREAMASFGDDKMLVEKYLTKPRHIEIQVFCDQHGNGVYLFERDCSVQRRHQKVIEEAPAPGMPDALRQTMGEAAIKAARAINYVGAGTVEFLLDEDGSFYFMEMNTRLQVEHPVTEFITRQDLVEWQLLVASGDPLPLSQDALSIHGHAFEARIYAEDPDNQFLPSTGNLRLLSPPEENDYVRVDTGVVQGDDVSVYYDPMIAKLVVWGENRDIALQRLLRALRQYHIDGVTTNIEFLYNVAASKPFVDAELTTTFIEAHTDLLFNAQNSINQDLLPVMALATLLKSLHSSQASQDDVTSPWNDSDAWRLNMPFSRQFDIEFNGEIYSFTLSHSDRHNKQNWLIKLGNSTWQGTGELLGETLTTLIDGHKQVFQLTTYEDCYVLFSTDRACHFRRVMPDLGELDGDASDADFAAPMNGTIVELLVSSGEKVTKGTSLIVMEAMKMEHTIKAPSDGKVTEFFFKPGELVDGGATLLAFESDDE